jgi:hypothetical protein
VLDSTPGARLGAPGDSALQLTAPLASTDYLHVDQDGLAQLVLEREVTELLGRAKSERKSRLEWYRRTATVTASLDGWRRRARRSACADRGFEVSRSAS